MDFKLKNILGETIHVSIYFPCNDEKEVKSNLDFIVYCHTHNGSKIEGMPILEEVMSNN